MCTVITKAQLGNPRVAKRDRKVYKVGICHVNNTFSPSFRTKFNYKQNVLVTTEFTYTTDADKENNNHCDNVEGIYRYSLKDPQFVVKGFHSFTTFRRAMNYSRDNYHENVAEFIIPKGAEYYINPARCAVSNQIIYKGQCVQ